MATGTRMQLRCPRCQQTGWVVAEVLQVVTCRLSRIVRWECDPCGWVLRDLSAAYLALLNAMPDVTVKQVLLPTPDPGPLTSPMDEDEVLTTLRAMHTGLLSTDDRHAA